ncbi:FtsK/SpoIIIE domain-containing protein [Ruminococcus albus]|uniref:DNA segregation ATPase FtsK/SpoIIIE, S-DNA-T family n=1 Tax=Ruminococcus albus TaxID=1264 RepID=A0A1I1R9V7_RUMAL|nr:FtsK/SpoIIIE domain-containing protein [Ruminococcus albus]SFD31052.1 DNA segregation ATPase FtsK/SpoIIIE, S-DNA-T family [Ruminococcus albus]
MKNNNNQRLKAGMKRMKEKKLLILIPLIFIAFMIFTLFVLLELILKMENPYFEKVYMIILYVVFSLIIVIGIVGIIRSLGKPLVSKKIEGELVDVGFVDNEGQSPILLSKKKDNHGFIFEFFSPRIPFYKYENHRFEIETALNIKVIDVLPGKDMQHTIIKAIRANNCKKETILWNDKFLRSKDFELSLGESYYGLESIDISTTPHVLIGGESGSGKSKLLKLLLMESIKKKAIIYLADFKGGIDYPTVWHNACSIITEPDILDSTLDCILKILEERRTMLVESGCSNISEYNMKTESDVHRIIVACDEIAEVLDKTGIEKEQKALVNRIESKFSTIARLGRAFGIHLMLATQRPDADILKGQIKNNIGYRICGRADKVLSQIILDNSDAADKITPSDQGVFLTNTGILFKAYYVNDYCLEGVDYNGETAD